MTPEEKVLKALDTYREETGKGYYLALDVDDLQRERLSKIRVLSMGEDYARQIDQMIADIVHGRKGGTP